MLSEHVDYTRKPIEKAVIQVWTNVDKVKKDALAGSHIDWLGNAALSHATEVLQAKLNEELNNRFQAAEGEEPIKLVIGNLYPGSIVRWVGGPVEMGADVVVEIPNYFGGSPWLVIIQVKNYTGTLGPSPALEQLKTAYDLVAGAMMLIA